ncbi:hypothetical protein B7P33_03165 [Sediminicola luteus]|uniref:HTH araC/xylS-type domain-containing protein n=2 Tax=Sediminicola luteus TaxID=319238 RepID=A0A2A4GFH5_9FLAO|nr:hypothetical protein B7P33_03165 [Sediminicola luteus]
MSGDADNTYFSDGITEEIINALTTIPGLRVIARTSAFAFKGKHIDIRSIAQQLGVSTVLEGSVRKQGDRVRVTAQFINAADGSHFWSKNYDRQLHDIFAIQDEISLLIAEQIRENFGHLEVEGNLKPHTVPATAAYDHYLKGLFYLKRKDFEDIKQAIGSFNEAVAIDPHYAEAHACLAEAYIHYMGFGEMDLNEAYTQIGTHIAQAMAADPENARAYKIDAYMKLFAWDWAGTETAYQKALDLGLPAANEFVSYYHIFVKNEKAHAIGLAQNLLLTDPLHAFSHWQLGACYYFDRQFEQALQAFDHALALEPRFGEALRWKGLVLGYLGRFEEALPLLDQALEVTQGQLLAKMDQLTVKILMGEKEAVLQEMEEISFHDPCDPAQLYALLDMPEKALPFLEQGLAQHSIMMISLRYFFVWDNLRGHDRFQALIQQMKFPEAGNPAPTKDTPKALLEASEIQAYSQQLDALMQAETLYTNPDLNLRALAQRLGLTPNKLSWLLNAHYQQNFNGYINGLRLALFKQKALEPTNQKLTLLGLAYECGFNSKTVFNTYFKKAEGQPPKAWLAQQR